jgi:hypothetical protein
MPLDGIARAALAWIGFVGALFVASIVLPGRRVDGRARSDGAGRAIG